MNSLERQNHIVELINELGTILVTNLSKRYCVSEVTIRNDLAKLESKGLISRFHGGATSNKRLNPYFVYDEIKLDERYKIFETAKKQIASYAAKTVKEGDTIIIDSGSTNKMLAEVLVNINNITIITNNLPAAVVLSKNSSITLALCGGTLRHKTYSMHGAIAEHLLLGISADILFIGADGIDSDRGITTFNDGYSISQIMAKAAKKVISLVDSSKFGKSCFNLILSLDEIDLIITDRNIDELYIESFKNKELNLQIA